LNRPARRPRGRHGAFQRGRDAQSQTYITFNHGKIFLVTAHAPTSEKNGDTVKDCARSCRDGRPKFRPERRHHRRAVLEHDEMAQSQTDTAASIVALIICASSSSTLQRNREPVKATIASCRLAYTWRSRRRRWASEHFDDHVRAILIGLAIDYGVHLVTRYEEDCGLANPRRGDGQGDEFTGREFSLAR